jgi:RNA-directed DNA polymerase
VSFAARCAVLLTQGGIRWSARLFFMTRSSLLSTLARAFLAGGASAEEIAEEAARILGRPFRWLGPLARRYVKAQGIGTRFRHRDAIQFLRRDSGLQRRWRRLRVEHWLSGQQRMQPVPAAAGWAVPAIETVGDLAEWLGVNTGELDWFADLKGLNSGRLSHYDYRFVDKGAGEFRIIEAPKPRLKALQRRILTDILERIPAHPAAHGFVKGRSIQTFAAPHVRKRAVLKMDLRDFFPSISAVRIQAFFRTAGYPESVADLLGGICTNAVAGKAPDPYRRPHLPQGAPTSPALANFCAYRLDCRLEGLAKAVGADYTRYADDLAFSGDADFERISTHVAAIAQEEGFAVNHRKTRAMRQGVRQRLAGLTANEKVNVIRADFDVLKATLTNCVRFGLESQNREQHPYFRAHLEGRVSFVESVNPEKARRLRAILDRIAN